MIALKHWLPSSVESSARLIGTLSKSRRRRQRRRDKTKDLMGRTIAQHVCFKTLYIPWLSSTKQQREIIKI